jgi:hypothetical protein
MGWLIDRWRSRQRRIDIDILWPSCRDQAHDLEQARMAFAMHAFHDKAWLCLGENEIMRQIGELN